MLAKFETYQLSLELYQSVKLVILPAHLRDQITRAAASICLNLAEGSAKPTERDRQKFYRIALGSCREVQAVIEMESLSEIHTIADHVGAHLYKLCLSRKEVA